ASGLVLIAAALTGCDRLDMYDQPRYEPLEASTSFADGLSARPPVSGTVARGELHEDESYYKGTSSGELVGAIPAAAYRAVYERSPGTFPQKSFDAMAPAVLRRTLLERGRERFNIHCAACHNATGDGDGIVVRRGFPKPPSYHTDKLRDAPVGHFFAVMTNGS